MARGKLKEFAVATMTLMLIGAHPATATIISPADVTLSLLGGLPSGNLTLDTGVNGDGTSLPTLTFGGGTLTGNIVSQTGGPEIAVFLFDGGAVFGAGNSLIASGGSRPIALLFRGSARIEGTIDVSGGNGSLGGDRVVGNGVAGVAGGGNGGQGGPFSSVQAGTGQGHGLAGSNSGSISGVGGGSGAGFGSDGGQGGAGTTTRVGGAAYGDPLRDLLQGGSGGGGGGGRCCNGADFDGGSGGGAGGGAIEIGALGELVFAGGSVLADGGSGGRTNRFSGGGGSGGGILLHAFDIEVDVNSLIQANGGSGEAIDGLGGPGGCGGAGRIEAIANTAGSLSIAGSVKAVGFGACADLAPVTIQLDDVGIPQVAPPVSSVPEPSNLVLFGFALAGLGVARWRKASLMAAVYK